MNDAMNTAILAVMLALPVVLVGGFHQSYAQEQQKPYLDVPNTYRDQLGFHILTTVWDPKTSSLESAMPSLESQDIRFGGRWFAFENKTMDMLERYSTLFIALVSPTEEQKNLILQTMEIPQGGEFLFEPQNLFLNLPDAPSQPSPIRLRVVFIDVVYTEQELVDFGETLIEKLSAAGYDVTVVGPDITRNAISIGFEKLDPEDIAAAKRIMIQRFGKEIPAFYRETGKIVAEPGEAELDINTGESISIFNYAIAPIVVIAIAIPIAIVIKRRRNKKGKHLSK